ncbi:MAG TPA: peptidoglycan DD-metalloendopeptidase family protein [Gemmatimonadota bacterium]|nr:peptidoglycan DD-metalloendopeptidase family protein [Gemmatimonadota bacterium]
MTEKHLTLLVVPHDEGNVRRLRVSYGRLRVLVGLGVLILALTGVAVLTYGRVAARATRVGLLERENQTLAEENAKVETLRAHLEQAERALQQIRRMAGLEELAPQADSDADAGEPPPAPSGSPGVPSAYPLAVQGFVTANFSGVDGHPGIDIAVPVSTPVVATADGAVRQKGVDPVYGHFVVLDHGEDFQTMYAHNEIILAERGDEVERGETIAYSGNSGRSSAPHLVVEVGRGGRAVDPGPYLP